MSTRLEFVGNISALSVHTTLVFASITQRHDRLTRYLGPGVYCRCVGDSGYCVLRFLPRLENLPAVEYWCQHASLSCRRNLLAEEVKVALDMRLLCTTIQNRQAGRENTMAG